MNTQEIILDVKKTLGIDIIGQNIRGEIQGELSKIDSSYLIYILATGFGKTKIALDSVKGSNVLIVHKQIAHKMSWEGEIKKWSFNYNVTYSTYNSLPNLVGQHYDTIILDRTLSN